MSKQGNGFTNKTFDFFADLSRNNNREWFNEHRATLDEHAREPFVTSLEDLSMRLAGSRLRVRGGRSTMFRINRDLRFTEDKRPYNENVSALLTETGTKDETGRLLYIELNAEGGRIGGGMHRAKASELKPVRQRIVDEPEAFSRVLDELAECDVEIDRSDQVETMPRGFADHSEHLHADVLRCTHLVAFRQIPTSAWLDDTAIERAAEAADALAGLYEFIDEARD